MKRTLRGKEDFRNMLSIALEKVRSGCLTDPSPSASRLGAWGDENGKQPLLCRMESLGLLLNLYWRAE